MNGETIRPGPLAGITVIELSRHLAGPWAAMSLGDLGADVIKIEQPGSGDDTRDWPPIVDGESTYFMSVNRNKRSVVVDLASDEGRRVIEALVRKADVIIDNFRAGVMDRLGYPDDTLEGWNPGLIRCSISAFGSSGPDRDRPGMDLLLQASSGLMSITGEEGRPPVRVGISMVDLIAGGNAVQAILAALFDRERTGIGQRVEVALLDGVLAWLSYHVTGFLLTGEEPRRLGASHASVSPYGAYPTGDGWLILAVGTDRLFRVLCGALGVIELADDPRFSRNSDRCANRDHLDPVLCERLASDSAESWAQRLGVSGVPCSPVRSVADALADPVVAHRELVEWLRRDDDPAGQGVPVVVPAFRLSRTPAAIRRPPPRLGEHTEEVIGRLDERP